jgi:deoxyribose-phosphate aldolase
MKPTEMLHYVDHTKLQAFAKWEDIDKLCKEAINYQMASVCIPPSYVRRVHEVYGDKLNICIVVGFPLGYSMTIAKKAEIEQGIADGANEFDMVVNISDVKNGDYQKVEDEIRTLKGAAGNHVLKVIIETCYLSEAEKIAMCQAVTNAGADYIKTSTGFGTNGATREDILLFKKHIGKDVKMKAAGGVKSISDLESFINAGCARIGSSSAIDIINKQEAKGY